MASEQDAVAALEAALKDPAQASRHDEIRAALDGYRARAGGGTPPEVAARRKAMTHEPEDPGSATGRERFMAMPGPGPTFADRAKALGSGMMSVGRLKVDADLNRPIEPGRFRQTVRGLDDAVTLGYGMKAADALHAALPAGAPGQGGAAGRHPFAETEAEDMQRFPDERTGFGVIGSGLPGVTNLVMRGAGAGARRMIPIAPAGPLAGAATGLVRGAVGYELAAPPLAALSASSSGRRLEAAKDAATDPLGLALSTALGAAGGAGEGKAARIESPKTESGRVLQEVKDAGGTVRMFGEPVEGGLYESPELQSLPAGEAGRARLATRGTGRVERANEVRLKTARAAYQDKIDEIIAAHGNEPHPTTETHAALGAMDAENTVNGVIGDEGTARAIGKVRAMLSQEGGADPAATVANVAKKIGLPSTPAPGSKIFQNLLSQAGKDDIVPQRLNQASAEDMVKTRKILRSLRDNSENASERRVYQVVMESLDADAAAVDPRIGQMTQSFRSAMEPIEQSNEILFSKKGREPGLTEAQQRTGINNLMRIGEESRAGLTREDALSRFEDLGPEYAREARLMRAKTAAEKLRRGEDRPSQGLLKTIAAGAARRGTGAGLGAAAGYQIAGAPGAVTGALAGFGASGFASDPLANSVRLTLPAARAASRLTGRSGIAADAVTRLARNRGRKKRRSEEEASP